MKIIKQNRNYRPRKNNGRTFERRLKMVGEKVLSQKSQNEYIRHYKNHPKILETVVKVGW